MNDFYIPGVWAQRYKHLPPVERADVDQEVDRRFRARTGITRSLDSKKDSQALVNRWLRIRDEVVAQMAGKGAPDPRKTSRGLTFGLPTLNNWAFLLLYNYDIGDHKPKPEHLKALDAVVFALLKVKGLTFRAGVIGHASRTGGESENQLLSVRRAAEVDKYLRKLAGPAMTFWNAQGSGRKDQVSADPMYHEAWPELESINEDERDRSVLVMFQWQPVGVIDALNAPNIDWDKAFDQAARRAALLYALGAFTGVISNYAPTPKVKGVPTYIPRTPFFPKSWTAARPDGDAVMRAIRPGIISDIELAARNMKLKISRDEIERRYEEWLKSPTNKWVP